MSNQNLSVVINTTKVRFFKQITTIRRVDYTPTELLLIPQRYDFSSKSQPETLAQASRIRCY